MESPESVSGPAEQRTRRSKACVNCVRIKCKCIPCGDAAGCQRCHRLKKTCVPSAVPSKKAVGGRPRRLGSRTQRLEAKISDLVDLLRTTQGISPEGLDGREGGVAESHTSPTATVQGLVDTPQTTATTATAATTTAGREEDSDQSPTEAGQIFRRFCDEMLPLEPILYLAPATTAQQLHRDAPFLWRCITAVAAPAVAHRCRFGAQARRQLLDRIVAGGERSLSELQGILVLLTWFHVLPAVDRQFAVLLSQLAVAVAWDLGLTMPPPLEPRVPGCGSGSGLTAPPYRTAPIPCVVPYKRERTTEERRTVLAVFSATSSVPLMPDGLRWSPYLEDCLAHLQQARQTAQDAVLVRHVRLRLLGSQMRHETAWSNAAATSSSTSTGRSGLVPAVPANLPPTFMESAQLYLDSIIDDPSCMDNFTTHNLYHYTRLTIHESALMRPSPPGATFDLHRLAVYQRCLESVRHTFDNIFTCPPDRYLCLPCGSVCLLIYVAVCLHRLTTLRDPSWSVEAVRDSIDLIATIDRVIAIFQDCQRQMMSEVAAASAAENVVTIFAIRKFQALRSVWLNEMPLRNGASSAVTTATATATEIPCPPPLSLFPAAPPPLPPVDDLDYYQWLPDLAMDLSWM